MGKVYHVQCGTDECLMNCHVLASKPCVKIPHFEDDVPVDISQHKQVGANSIHTKLLKQGENTLSQRLYKVILLSTDSDHLSKMDGDDHLPNLENKRQSCI